MFHSLPEKNDKSENLPIFFIEKYLKYLIIAQ